MFTDAMSQLHVIFSTVILQQLMMASTAAVLFVGTKTQVTDVYGIKTDKRFVNTLEDNIIQRGAPHKLLSDRAQVIISNKVLDILCTLLIGNWKSYPQQQQQNPV